MEKIEAGLNKLRSMEGLDVEQGILYCNGEDAYIEILQAYCENWESTGVVLNELFENKDWENYTIAVHGLKSSLFSIGVNKISEMAKQLEYAGKENRIAYIEEHHAGLMESYKTFFRYLLKSKWLFPVYEETEEKHEDLKELSDEEFDRIISEMEEAAYTFNIDTLMELAKQLAQYSYKGNIMEEVLAPVKRKFEMSDYISAVEMLANRKREMMN